MAGCLLIAGAVLLGVAAPALAEMWKCKQGDGATIFSDRNLTGQCTPVDESAPLMRVPSVPPPGGAPPEEAMPDAGTPAPKEPAPVPTPGRGRRIDPPNDAVITIRDLTAGAPSYNSLLGIANYQATMFLENGDTEWTAEKVCITVRFRDVSLVFVDVNQVGCMEGLKPLGGRTFTVTYTGMIPPRLFPIMAEAKVDYVKWTK
ncbi:MAG: hypothetical protein EPO02_05655 [Nitrospirae bacterium]|nr:MAG: hypothetical protein EPO02_05655 [Nitrospirota bacterium]